MCYPTAGAEYTSDKIRRVKMYIMSRLLKQNIKYNKIYYNTIQYKVMHCVSKGFPVVFE